MHQFIDYLIEDKNCSCGKKLDQCEFWGEIIKKLNIDRGNLKETQFICNDKESHKNILYLLIFKSQEEKYLQIQETFFDSISICYPKQVFLDSSKYIARYLLLKKSSKLDLKGIYVVRDVRGVINSFKKKVQTPKNVFQSILYYMAINFFGELIYLLDKNVVKVKYEDLLTDPSQTLNKIYLHSFEKASSIKDLPEGFKMPHIVGGNRMKIKRSIKINADIEWKTNIPRAKQIVYYILALPFMIINKYRI